MPAATRRWAGMPEMSRSSNRTRPEASGIRPAIAFSSVVFPAPLAPTMVTTCPRSTSIEAPVTARIAP